MKASEFMTAILEALLVREGKMLLVSSDLTGLALQAAARSERFSADELLDRLKEKVGHSGTLLLPTFNFDFCDGKPFDLRRSPSRTGALSAAALVREDFQRTHHPIHSFAVWGKERDTLCRLDNRSSFGPDSPFAYLHKNAAEMLIIGLGYQGAFTFVHYVEETESVPYRLHKEFRAPYVDAKGREEVRAYSMYVRDLTCGVDSAVDPIGELLEEKRIAESTQVFGVPIRRIRLAEAYEVIAKDIHQNRGRRLHVAREADPHHA